jgi:hypothetical protein
MSFDVYFQRFLHGEAEPGGGLEMRRVLEPYITREEPEHHFAEVVFRGGQADVYLDDDDLMANHVSGERPWDLLVDGAKAAGFVIIPPGCPTCLTDESQRAHLPEGLNENAVLVKTGVDLLAVFQSG